MGTEYTVWRKEFKKFSQVESVSINSSAGRLDETIKNRKEGILQVTHKELDDIQCKFNGNLYSGVIDYLTKKGVIVYYKDTLVAYFDIIGYSSYIATPNEDDKIHKISEFFNAIKNTANTNFLAVKFDYWILSDAVIIVVDNNRHPLFCGSLEYFLGTCSDILRYSMREGFPLKEKDCKKWQRGQL